MATSSFEREVLKSGYLTKSPSSGGRGRLKRRWFVLTSSKQDNPPASGNGASASSSSSFRLDYYEKENHARKGSIDLGARCLMLEDPDHLSRGGGGKKRRHYSSCFNLILLKESSKHKSRREAFASRFQLQASSDGEKRSWLQAFQQCGVNIHRTDKDADDRSRTKSTFFIGDDSNNELEDSTSITPTAIPVPRVTRLSTELAATVPGGLTFASCAGEDVPLSELYGGENGGLTNSYNHSHTSRSSITPNIMTRSCEDIFGYGTSDQQLSPSPRCRDSKDSMDLFHGSTEYLVTLPQEESQCEPLSDDLHQLSKQLESTSHLRNFNHDQVFLSCDTLSGGHFNAVHKATLLPHPDEPALQTVSVRVIGSHCSEREAVQMLQEAFIMAQLSHRNVAAVLGMVLSQQPKMIVLEYVSSGDLQTHLQSLQPQAAERGVAETLPTKLLNYCQQIACGMTYLVDRGCVVSTLATRFILITDSEEDVCKITGVECPSYRLSHDQVAPPPMCQDEDSYRFDRDIWSFGTVLYEVWSLGRSPCKIYEKMHSMSRVSLPPPPGCSRHVYKLMMRCWNAATIDKPTWLGITGALADPDVLTRTAEELEGRVDPPIPHEAFILGSPLQASVNLYRDIQKVYHHSAMVHPQHKAGSAFQDTIVGKDWRVNLPVTNDTATISLQEVSLLVNGIEHTSVDSES